MQHLAVLKMRPDATKADQSNVRDAEVRQVWELVKADKIRSIHFMAEPARGAVLVVEASDLGEAMRHVESLPAVKSGLLQPEVIGLVPFNGYEALFRA